jgi:hypothetical protein
VLKCVVSDVGRINLNILALKSLKRLDLDLKLLYNIVKGGKQW